MDVLTLTATPIPRTLSMALAGVRGISTLETPPEERLAARTIVTRFEAPLVREALEREFARGGQAFFVHNRDRVDRADRRLPAGAAAGARIGVAHARMPGAALEEVMHRFHAGEIDLLLATAIVGAGLDVPRANTLIVDRADRFGLADLYQLKGRVGRSDRRAFAYSSSRTRTASPRRRGAPGGADGALLPRRRLPAGAARPGDPRGGDLLGAEQSGHVAAVGFDLYLEMLAEAVAELTGEAPPARVEPCSSCGWPRTCRPPGSTIRRCASRCCGRSPRRGTRERSRTCAASWPTASGRRLPRRPGCSTWRSSRGSAAPPGSARIEEFADRRYRVAFAEGRVPGDASRRAVEAALGARIEDAPDGFTLDLARRSWEEIRRLLAKALQAGEPSVAGRRVVG